MPTVIRIRTESAISSVPMRRLPETSATSAALVTQTRMWLGAKSNQKTLETEKNSEASVMVARIMSRMSCYWLTLGPAIRFGKVDPISPQLIDSI